MPKTIVMYVDFEIVDSRDRALGAVATFTKLERCVEISIQQTRAGQPFGSQRAATVAWTLEEARFTANLRIDGLRYAAAKHGQKQKKALAAEAGHVAEAVCQASGSRIVVYVAAEQGIDCGARYAVVCSAHASIAGETSLRRARSSMRNPEFCEACKNASLLRHG